MIQCRNVAGPIQTTLCKNVCWGILRTHLTKVVLGGNPDNRYAIYHGAYFSTLKIGRFCWFHIRFQSESNGICIASFSWVKHSVKGTQTYAIWWWIADLTAGAYSNPRNFTIFLSGWVQPCNPDKQTVGNCWDHPSRLFEVHKGLCDWTNSAFSRQSLSIFGSSSVGPRLSFVYPSLPESTEACPTRLQQLPCGEGWKPNSKISQVNIPPSQLNPDYQTTVLGFQDLRTFTKVPGFWHSHITSLGFPCFIRQQPATVSFTKDTWNSKADLILWTPQAWLRERIAGTSRLDCIPTCVHNNLIWY